MEIDISKPILDRNERLAAENRALFDSHGVYVLDLMASPGAGKTSTILATIATLRDRYRIAVIEGDIASKVDAERVKAHGIPAVQINTGGACHLESDMIKRAIAALDLDQLDLLIVENVGNLVCPTDFYLGEDAKVMILSVPEGDDKPLKYPGIFQVSEAVILNKVDTMPFFDFDEGAFRSVVRAVNPKAPVFPIAATKGEGVQAWTDWLAGRIEEARARAAAAAGESASQGAEDAGEASA
jgi:hydrogenase nickel incorporation protein HypB